MLMEGFLSVAASPANIIAIFLATFVGIIFGAIPGLTATMAVTVFLPLTYAMGSVQAMSTLMGLYIGGISGGLISAILLKIPGTPASTTTTFDGVPMAEKGEAAKALGFAIVFSFLGTIFGLLMLCLISPLLASVAIKFGPFEYCALSIFSLSLIIALTGRDMLKGLIAALIGVMLGTVGMSSYDSAVRFTFGEPQLMDGFKALTISIGLYAVTQIFLTAESKNHQGDIEIKAKVKMKGLGFTLKEFKDQIVNGIISACIGVGIGILPGIGGGTSAILSYTVVRNKSKHPELFGTGVPDGVVASETANNSAIGGAMIPLLTLGIPGDGTTAVLLGALTIHSISPGPLIFEKNGALMYGLYTAILLSSIFMIFMEFLGLPFFIKVLQVPKHYLMPVIAILCSIGAFGVSNRVFNIWVVFFIGLAAFILQKLDIPLAPVILGFILGPIFETNFRRAEQYMAASNAELFQHPIAIVFMLVTFAVLILNMKSNHKIAKAEKNKNDEKEKKL